MYFSHKFQQELIFRQDLPSFPATCRKCRRELLIHAILVILHFESQLKLFSKHNFHQDNKSNNVDHQCWQLAVALLLALERDSYFHYVTTWKTWCESINSNKVTSPSSIFKRNIVEGKTDTEKHKKKHSPSVWESFSFLIQNNTLKFDIETSLDLRQTTIKPITDLARNFLKRHNVWFPLKKTVTCSRCNVWMIKETCCRCSLYVVCVSCYRNYINISSYAKSTAFWNIPSATSSTYHSRSLFSCDDMSKSYMKNPLHRTRSLPPLRQINTRRSTNSFKNHGICSYIAQKGTEINCFFVNKEIQKHVDNFFTNNSLVQTFLAIPISSLNKATITKAASILPCFLRILPLTHYVTLLHGLNGTPKDYRKFIDLLLYTYPDIHCFVPCCYSNKATMGISVVTETLKHYLLFDTPQPLGLSRLPRDCDLFSNLSYFIKPKNYEDISSTSNKKLYRTTDKSLVRIRGCYYILGEFPYEIFKSRILMSFIGHSLGGIIGRSLLTLNELRFNITASDVSLTLISNSNSPNQKNVAYFLKSSKSNKHNKISHKKINVHLYRETVMLVNFVTFASPHNGIFEDYVGIQAFSYILPTARDLITASPALLQLTSPEAILPLCLFPVLVLYGNICNDFLVGPYTSLLIHPKTAYTFPVSFFLHGDARTRTPVFCKVPICALKACSKNKKKPVELDSSGYLVSTKLETTTQFNATSMCDEPFCIHNSSVKPSDTNQENIIIREEKSHYALFVDKFRWDSKRLRSVCQAAFFGNLRFPENQIDALSEETAPVALPKMVNENSKLQTSPLEYVQNLSRLHWKRFAVLFENSFQAHSCITWHGRLDPANSGKCVVQHFIDDVFVNNPKV